MIPKGVIQRREFVKRAALGLFSSIPVFGLFQSGPSGQSPKPKIIYRTLGKTKLKIPLISFGVMNSDNPDLIRKALNLGFKHFDTAHTYLRGNSERVIGEVLEETRSRDKVYIATKMRFAQDEEKGIYLADADARQPGANEENFNNQLAISLQRLRTDYVDILYLHRCLSPKMVTYEPLMKALVKAKESGKARFIGVTTHMNDPEIIRAAVDIGIYDVVLTSYNFMQQHKEEVKKAIQYASEKKVGIVAMKTQGGARLSQKTKAEVNHEAALKWVLNDENVCTAIPGITTFEQMDLDFSVMSNLALSESEKRELELASMLKGPLYCQNCRSCVSFCPHNVEIPSLMRAYMYAEGYGNLVHAEMTVAELPERRGLNVCNDCLSCAASCRYGIDIHSRIKYLIGREIGLG